MVCVIVLSKAIPILCMGRIGTSQPYCSPCWLSSASCRDLLLIVVWASLSGIGCRSTVTMMTSWEASLSAVPLNTGVRQGKPTYLPLGQLEPSLLVPKVCVLCHSFTNMILSRRKKDSHLAASGICELLLFSGHPPTTSAWSRAT